MIPAEAVEAAQRSLCEQFKWEGDLRKEVRIALEAAAPHMLAAAWAEGGRAAIEREHAYGADEKAKFSNPYRSKQ